MATKLLTAEQIQDLGEYTIDVNGYLKQFIVHQDEDKHYTSDKFWFFINAYEQYVFHFANKLSEGAYTGGYWTMENGFFELQGKESTRYKVSGNYREAELNCLGFSLLVNIMALSHLCIWAYNQDDQFCNQLAVFFSEYCKKILYLNKDQCDIDSILIILD